MAYIGQAPTNAPLSSSDIQDGVIVAADLADDSVGTDEIVNDAVTADKLANSINTAIAANTAKVSFTPDAAQVFNESSADVDFRVEASGAANALFVQGSDGNVGIGTGAPSAMFEVNCERIGEWAFKFFNDASDGSGMLIYAAGSATANAALQIKTNDGGANIAYFTGQGNCWVAADVSAATFTDRTPYPETLQLAYDVINSHKRLPENEYKADDQNKQLDHTELHEYVKRVSINTTFWEEKDELPEGVSVGDIKEEETENGRNMSASVSCLIEIVKDLSTKVTALENA